SDTICDILHKNFEQKMITIAAPIAYEKKGEFVVELTRLFEKGYYRVIIDGEKYKFRSVDEIKDLKLQKTHKHSIDVLVDMLEVLQDDNARLQEAVETAFKLANGTCKIMVGDQQYVYSKERMCIDCLESFTELEPRFFSFNSPIGACKKCEGLGVVNEWSSFAKASTYAKASVDRSADRPWTMGDSEFFGEKYATTH